MYSTVWRGQCRGTMVAVKIPKDVTRDTLAIAPSIIQEMSALRSPDVSSLIGVCLEEDTIMFITELMSGNVRKLLQSRLNLSLPLRLRMALDVSTGMQYLHSSNIIHGGFSSFSSFLFSLFFVSFPLFSFFFFFSPNLPFPPYFYLPFSLLPSPQISNPQMFYMKNWEKIMPFVCLIQDSLVYLPQRGVGRGLLHHFILLLKFFWVESQVRRPMFILLGFCCWRWFLGSNRFLVIIIMRILKRR